MAEKRNETPAEPETVEVEYTGDSTVREIDKKSFESVDIDHPKVVWDKRGNGKARMSPEAAKTLVEKFGDQFRLVE